MIGIISMGSYHPDNVIDNDFLQNLGIDSDPQWIIDKIGIKERRSVLPLDYIKETKNKNPKLAEDLVSTNTINMSLSAINEALEKANIKKEQIGLIICNTCTPISTHPSTAQKIALELNLNCKAYDVNTACPAFALHMHYLNSFQEDKLPEYVLCVSTAAITQRVDYSNRSDSAIWGDAAAAWIVGKKDLKLKVLTTSFDADPKRCDAVVIDRDKHFEQDGRAVRDFSVRQTVRMIKRHEKEYNLDWNKDIFIGHQANATMLRQITNNRKIPASNHWSNVDMMGNQAAAGAACVLSENWHKLESGQKVLVSVLGAGLSWGSVLFEVK